MKKLNRYGQIKVVKRLIEKRFQTMCYEDHCAAADEALEAIETYQIPDLNHYIEKHIRTIMDQFAKSHLSDCFTCDMNTISCVENCDRMLKRGMTNRIYSLVEARTQFIKRLDNHQMIVTENAVRSRSRSRSRPCNIEFVLGIALGS
jgi:hypothetical protein